MAFENLHSGHYAADAIELPPAADLIAMLDQGETYDTLAATFACHPTTIQPRVRRSGLRDTRPTVDGLPLLAGGEIPEWYDRSLCAQTDPEAFYPEQGGSTRAAKAVCAACEVRTQCLDFALAIDERHGVWGGMSDRERRKLRRATDETQEAS